jgi:hypothetical protein
VQLIIKNLQLITHIQPSKATGFLSGIMVTSSPLTPNSVLALVSIFVRRPCKMKLEEIDSQGKRSSLQIFSESKSQQLK